MTVWIVNPFDNLPLEGFRPQRYWMMSQAFTAAGHSVVYFTADFNHGTKRKREWRRKKGEWIIESVRLVMIPVREYRKNVCVQRILSHRDFAKGFVLAAMSEMAKPDVVIASTPPLGSAAAALRIARRIKAKFILDVQDAWPETFGRLLPRPLKGLGALIFAPMYLTARRLYRSADVVTGVSERYREISGRSDFRLFRLGIFSSVSDAPYGDSGQLVYLGNLGDGYDLETVIEAVSRERRLTLDIAGKGPKEESLKSLVSRLGLNDRVKFHGYLDEKQVKSLLSKCGAGIVPMRDDSWVGIPNKVYDYLAAGLPVLTSLTGECGDLIRKHSCGAIYENGSVQSFLETWKRLVAGRVALPQELAAENIYRDYVSAIMKAKVKK